MENLIPDLLEQSTIEELLQISDDLGSLTTASTEEIKKSFVYRKIIVHTVHTGLPILTFSYIAYYLQAEFAKRGKSFVSQEKQPPFDYKKISEIIRKDYKLIGDALVEMPVGDVRELQSYLTQTYSIHMVMQLNDFPNNNIGYAAGS